jgi:exopolyphosphatase/guanosine-5'-triphosphate,3'-diphosphate pyrophosphatase
MNESPQAETYAAVDLGSNSFHMLVSRREHGELRVLDRIKEMVRLGGGLDDEGNLDPAVRQRALDCLSRFGQRLRGIPRTNLRAVGTQTFRRLKNGEAFLHDAESALECPIDTIAGREEARLVYLGVSQWVAGHSDRQLVIDIGGGSTELIIGEGIEPIEMESMQFGCVSVTNRFFSDGTISAKRLKQAQAAVAAELQELQTVYRKSGWKTAIGSSGTFRSAAAICVANGWSRKGITRQALKQLKKKALSFNTIEAVQISGLSERRQPVFIGGLAIILALFDALSIKDMLVSPFALREGVLQDLLGRLENRDPRDKSVKAFMSRFAVDPAQVDRVKLTALALFEQLSDEPSLGEAHKRMLSWAADLHETGLNLSHASYQEHSAYLITASDMAGFSRPEQLFLAALVGYHRRQIPPDFANALPSRLHRALALCLLCMRLSWIFCRTREDNAIPPLTIGLHQQTIKLRLPKSWRQAHPLTVADLDGEAVELKNTGLNLTIDYTDDESRS